VTAEIDLQVAIHAITGAATVGERNFPGSPANERLAAPIAVRP
jgi:hypothetical protein